MKALWPQHTLREYIARYEKEHTQFGTKLTHMIGIPMIVASIPTAFVSPAAAVGLAVGGWTLQYVGHYVFEGNTPAFYGDPYYLLVGPVWVAGEWLQLLGLPVPDAMRAAQAEGPHPETANGEAAIASN